MDTEKKAKKIIIAALILVLVIAIVCFVNSTPKEAVADDAANVSVENTESALDSYVFPQINTYKNEGYNSFPEWWDAVMEQRSSYVGIAAEVEEEYSEYITDEQVEKLQSLEKSITNATTLTSIGKYRSLIERIEAQLSQEKEEVEAAAQVAAASTNVNTGSNYQYSGGNSSSYDGNGFKSQGVVNWNGTRYTWYSSNVLYHYRTGEWSVNSDGFYTDSSGNLICASDDYALGTIVSTPWGDAVVADTGAGSGTLDMYTNF